MFVPVLLMIFTCAKYSSFCLCSKKENITRKQQARGRVSQSAVKTPIEAHIPNVLSILNKTVLEESSFFGSLWKSTQFAG